MQRRTAPFSFVFRIVLVVCASAAGGGLARAAVYTWNSGDIVTGTIAPSGLTTVISGDQLHIVSPADHDFGGKNVVNNGEVRWMNGNLRGGSSLTNNAAWNDSASSSLINAAFSAYAFYNGATGIYTKSAGTTTFNVGFANDGVISVTGGTIDLAAGGTFTNGSVSSSSGSGVLQLTGGLLSMTGNVTANNFLFNGGNVSGDHTFINSALTWQAGTWNSVSTTTIASTSTLTINGVSDIDFNGHAIVNNGTINWNAGNLRSGGNGTITNNATWNDSATASYNRAYGGGAKFINGVGGTYYKIGGNSTFANSFENYGAVIASGGTLNFADGGIFYDGSTAGSTGSGVVQLTGGVLTAGGSGGFTATNFLLTAGQLSGNMTFLGTTVWTGSDFNTTGTATVGSGGTLNIAGTGNHDFTGHAMVNNGTVNWTGGALRSGTNGTFTNNATLNDSTTSSSFNAAYGGGAKFVNGVAGTYVKSTGVTTFSTAFENRGVVSVTGGTLNLDAGGIFYGGSSIGSTGLGLVQLTGGALTASGAGFTANNFTLTSGAVSGNVTFLGTTIWTGTNFNNAGTATVGTGATFNVNTTANHDFNGHAMVNNGTINWSAGSLRSGGAGTFTNNAIFNDSANSTFNAAFGGGATFTNAVGASYNKSANTTTYSILFKNLGTISVTGGTLNLGAGGVFYDGSTIGSSGSGAVQLTGGTLTANGTAGFTSNNLVLAGGDVAGNITFLGTTNWQGTYFNGGVNATFQTGGTLNILSTNDHDFNASALVNNGTVNWSAGNVRSGGAGTFTNNGTWNDSATSNFFNAAYGGGATFINAATGIYNKTAGATTISIPLVNRGNVAVTGGSLTLSNGGVFYDGSTIGSSGSGTVQLTGGTLTANGTAGFTSNNLDLVGGDVAGAITFLGTTQWSGAVFDAIGTALFGSGGVLNIVSAGDHNFNGRLMVNNGTVNWSGGSLRSGGGGSFTNNATWNDSVNGYSYNAAYGGGATFVNAAAGTYNKSAGTTTISTPMTNAGTVNVTGGTLAVNGAFTNTTGTVAVGTGAVFSSTTPLTFGANSVVRGTGSITTSSLSSAGTLAPGTIGTAGLLTINGDLSLMSTSLAFFELAGTTLGTQYDHLIVSGATTLGGTLVINFASGFISSVNDSMTFELISAQSLSGAFSNAPNGSRFATADNLGVFTIHYGAGSNFGVNKVVLTDFTAVPEPSTWMLIIAGAGMLAVARRRSRP